MRGRTVVFVLLAGFVVLTTGVIFRRSYGVQRAREIVKLESRRSALAAQRAKLDRDIRETISMDRLGRVAEERLHMRVPSDSIVVTLERPARVIAR
jgi:cell division protein FtsL